MTKGELINIIHKIQNRCGLEDPIAVRYYWNDEGKAVFKAFFESLYLPESLRVDEDLIQNTFLVQNVYEYEDDFELLELNQDEGYIAFIPDDQDFKVVKNHKDATKKEDKKEESLVHLCDSRILSEGFARSKGFILRESDRPSGALGDFMKNQDKKVSSNQPGEEGAINAQAKGENGGKEKTKCSFALLSFENPLAAESFGKIKGIVNSIDKSTLYGITKTDKEIPLKLILGIPVPDNTNSNLPSYTLACYYTLAKALEATKGSNAFAYVATKNGNERVLSALNASEIAAAFIFKGNEEVCEKVVSQANLPKFGDNSSRTVVEKDSEGKELAFEDPTKDSMKALLDAATAVVDTYKEQIQKCGGVRPDPSRTLKKTTGKWINKNIININGEKSKNDRDNETDTKKLAKTADIVGDVEGKDKDNPDSDSQNVKETGNKGWDKYVAKWNSLLSNHPKVGVAMMLCKDLYTHTAMKQDKEQFQARLNEINGILKDFSSKGTVSPAQFAQLSIGERFKSAGLVAGAAALSNLSGTSHIAGKRDDDDTTDDGGMFASQKTQHGANASSKNVEPEKGTGKEKETKKVADYYNDFPIWCAFMSGFRFSKLEDVSKHIDKNPDPWLSTKFAKLVELIDNIANDVDFAVDAETIEKNEVKDGEEDSEKEEKPEDSKTDDLDQNDTEDVDENDHDDVDENDKEN